MNQMDQAPIIDQLLRVRREGLISFHMPGHKHGRLYQAFPYHHFHEKLTEMDVTEIPGTDNLHYPQGAIAAAQAQAQQAFQSEETFFVVNGSTAGIYSLLMAVAGPGDQVLVNRNCHQSVIHGLFLGGCTPVYLYPEMDLTQGIALGINPKAVETVLIENPEIKAVLITYPTYHGIGCDLEEIARIVHHYGKILLVDEAHGAHFGLSPQLPKPALACGADGVVQSTHKTLPAFTQCAMVHIQGPRIDRERLRMMLRIHQTSSPSYILMASLDWATYFYQTQGPEIMKELLEAIEAFRAALAELSDYEILGQEAIGKGYIHQVDPTRLWIHHRSISGDTLSQILRRDYQIQMELSSSYGILGIATVGTTKDDLIKLLEALKEIAHRHRNQPYQGEHSSGIPLEQPQWFPQQVYGPREAIYKRKKTVPLGACDGMVAATTIVPYPPGIPLLVPGERIAPGMAAYLASMLDRGMEVLGVLPGATPKVEVLVED